MSCSVYVVAMALLAAFAITSSERYRNLRAGIRKAMKRPMLWLNAWRFKESEAECSYLMAQREDSQSALYREHLKQMKLRAQREQINSW